ncbi:RNA-directed DNA polymerase [Tanacetum coccineum]
MVRDVHRVIERCKICHIAKTHRTNAGLYTAPWEEMAHFVPCSKTFDASQVARLYFAEIVKLHGIPKTLTSNRDVKFVSHFGGLLRILIGEHPKQWDLTLPQAAFAYNRSPNRTTDADEQSKKIKDLHQEIYLHKDRFLAGQFSKLKPRADSPFRVQKKINDNAYKIELLGHYNVSATFNLSDLSPYFGESEDEEDSWMSLSQAGDNDALEAKF